MSTPRCSHSSPCAANGRTVGWWKCRRLSPILPCCSRLWSRTLTFQFVVVEGKTSIFKVFFPDRVPVPYSSLERISEQIVEQTVDIPVSVGGLADFRPGQSSSSVAHSPAAWLNPEDEPFQRVFRTFSREGKKCNCHPAHGCESAPARQLIHVVCLWPAHLGGRRHG